MVGFRFIRSGKSSGKRLHGVMLVLATAFVALAAGLSATPFLDSPSLLAKGWGSQERAVNADLWGGLGGATIDPEDPDAFYYFNGLEIRRYDFADSADVLILSLPVPAGFGNFQGGPFGAFLAFDPADTDYLYFAESTDGTLREIRFANNSRVSVFSSDVIYTSASGVFMYAAAFDASVSPSRMVLSESLGFGMPNALVFLDRSTSPATRVELGQVSGASGSPDFDLAGNLYYVYPQGEGPTAGASDVELVHWDAATVAAALADPTGSPLGDGNAVSERIFAFTTLYSGYGSLLTREEGGAVIIYMGNTEDGSIARVDISDGSGASDDLEWAITGLPNNGTTFIVSPGNLSTSSKIAEFGADEGQYDESGSAPSARLMVGYTFFQPASIGNTLAAVAQIVPNNTATEIATVGVISQPTGVSVNRGFTISLEYLDAGGSRVTTGDASIDTTFSAMLNGSGTLSGPSAFGLGSSIGAGVVTLANYSIDAAQTGFTIDFTHTGSGNGATTAPINAFDAATKLAITTAPAATGRTGVAFGMTVQVQDSSNALVTQGSDAVLAVTVSVGSGTGVLGGTTTVNAVAGVATFSGLTYDTVESGVTLAVSASGVTNDAAGAMTFTPGAAALAILTQPTQVDPEANFSFSVEIRDAGGAKITSGADATASVTLSLQSGTGTLSGTKTVAAVSGTASFSGLSLTPGGIYVLRASSVNGTTVDSASILAAFLTQGTAANDQIEGTSCSLTVGSGAAFAPLFAVLLAAVLPRRRRASPAQSR